MTSRALLPLLIETIELQARGKRSRITMPQSLARLQPRSVLIVHCACTPILHEVVCTRANSFLVGSLCTSLISASRCLTNTLPRLRSQACLCTVARSQTPTVRVRLSKASGRARGKQVRFSRFSSPSSIIVFCRSLLTQGEPTAGSYDYKALPLPGSTTAFDARLVASSCYNPSTREWISYDSPEAAAAKATFIDVNGLGGAMWWELSGDRKRGDGGLVAIVRDGMAGSGPIDSRPNWLDYRTSKWENMRKGMQ